MGLFIVPGPVGATRERGRRVREQVEAVLTSSPPGDTVILDLRELEAVSVSFADELIGRLLAAKASGDFVGRALVLQGSGEDMRETVEAVLSRRRLPAIYMEGTQKPVPLGGPPWFAATVRQASQLKSFAVAELARHLGLSPQATNNRLRELETSGVVVRERVDPAAGGRQYRYRTLVSFT